MMNKKTILFSWKAKILNNNNCCLNNFNLTKRKCHNLYNNHRLNDMPLSFKPKEVEHKWAGRLSQEKLFFKNSNKNSKVFSMILPPPNVTGTLHLGHVLTTTIQDVISRWSIMRGCQVVWIPGLDHAGIATQAVVEKYLFKTKKIKRGSTSKEEFLKHVNDWTNEKSEIINSQLKRLATTLDWSKEYYTMSKDHNNAVTKAFVTLSNKNLLYRDNALVNWSPSLGSAISEFEVEHKIVTGKTEIELPGYNKKVAFGQIYKIAYDVIDSDERLIVATTRPETIFGDTALAFHPDDERYSHLTGKFVRHPFKPVNLPIIQDHSVIMDFGTGVVKVTPAHNQFDYKIACKHNLEVIDIIDENGNLNQAAGHYKGLPRFVARNKILDDLANKGALISIKDHTMDIPMCSRTGDVIELLLREQWFLKCKDMAAKASKVVQDGLLKLDPSYHEEKWFNWSNNIKDWCISRQLWWGHQIPAYYFTIDNVKHWIISESEEMALLEVRKKYGNDIYLQRDEDVLDTWFSSSLLPFTSFGWPNMSADFQKYYPLSLMESGHDILNFWVLRMVMLGLELTDKLPFEKVLLHGLLCDANGKKMSKSSGNVILPENIIDGISLKDLNNQTNINFENGILNDKELKRTLKMNQKLFPKGIPECGIDALRFSLCSRNIKELTVSFNVGECEQNKFFFNKIFQASRYVLLMTEDEVIVQPNSFTVIDKWILSRLCWMVETVNNSFANNEFNKALAAIKEFIYYEFCDYYVEGTKTGLKSENEEIIKSHRFVLSKCLEVVLRVLYPVTPYFSSDLYSRLSNKLSNFKFENSLLEHPYPDQDEFVNFRDIVLEDNMKDVIRIILLIRSLLGNASKKADIKAHVVTHSSENKELYEQSINIITAVSKIKNVEIFNSDSYNCTEKCIFYNVDQNCTVFLVIEDGVILGKIRENLEKKKLKAQKKLNELLKKCSLKDYNLITTEDEKLNDQQKILSLQQDLLNIPNIGSSKDRNNEADMDSSLVNQKI